MIGFYDYTVILTYLSLMSGTIGIMLCLNGMGHPYLGMFFLLFSGLCDTFDGKVARSKKDRTTQMKKFGIQIDSLSDLLAFGMKRQASAKHFKLKCGFPAHKLLISFQHQIICHSHSSRNRDTV